jgi:hypothetical protein
MDEKCSCDDGGAGAVEAPVIEGDVMMLMMMM